MNILTQNHENSVTMGLEHFLVYLTWNGALCLACVLIGHASEDHSSLKKR